MLSSILSSHSKASVLRTCLAAALALTHSGTVAAQIDLQHPDREKTELANSAKAPEASHTESKELEPRHPDDLYNATSLGPAHKTDKNVESLENKNGDIKKERGERQTNNYPSEETKSTTEEQTPAIHIVLPEAQTPNTIIKAEECHGPGPFIRTGNHPGFGRLVLNWQTKPIYDVIQLGQLITVTFKNLGCIAGLEAIAPPKNMVGIGGGGNQIVVALAPGASNKIFILNNALVIDAID